jgi:MGT family glycosyltransferase
MSAPDIRDGPKSDRIERPTRILAAMFQGGGNIPLLMPVIRRLIERGHHLRIMAGPGVRRSRLPLSSGFVRQITDGGASLIPFREPAKHPYDDAPPLKGLVGNWAPQAFRGIAPEAQTFLWSRTWAENIRAELRERPADLLVADFVLFGALAAAEAARTPSVALMHTIAIRPLPGLPPYGTGWRPAQGAIAGLRDAIGRVMFERVHGRNALLHLNAARTTLGLAPLRSAFEQYDRASRVLMLVSPSFDYPSRRLPPNMRHVGTPIDDAAAQPWESPWARDGQKRPLVLVSLSTLNQGQTPLLHRVLLALARLDVRAIVTVGPSLDATGFVAPSNVRLEQFVPHSAVLPHVDALVTQCGLGTLTKGLVAGVPLVCLPLVGDQPDNAARIEAHGAGLRLPANASPEQISATIERVLVDRRFREGAQRLSSAMSREGNAIGNAVEAIESTL